jgi:hypothetical protein
VNDSKTARKVLFVTSNRIGDCVISSGVIREIARQVPGAGITVACGRPPAPFFRSAPEVERVIILDKKKMAGHWFDLWRQVVGTRWDLVIDIRGSALSYLIPAKRRVVYNRGWETGLRKVEMVSRMMGAPAPLDPEIFLDARAFADRQAVLDPQLAGGERPRPDHRPGPDRPPTRQELAGRALGRTGREAEGGTPVRRLARHGRRWPRRQAARDPGTGGRRAARNRLRRQGRHPGLGRSDRRRSTVRRQ